MNSGLDDVVAAETTLSDIDASGGALIIRGRSLDELAGIASYEETLALLWSGFFDETLDAAGLRRALGRGRKPFDAKRRSI